MIPLPSRSPFTGGEIVVTRFYCPESDTSVEGQFAVTSPFAQLSVEQVEFIELFVRSEGRISRMEGELGLSYPTIRSRLKEIVEALGYEAHDESADDEASSNASANSSDGQSVERIAVENINVEPEEQAAKRNQRSRTLSAQERQRVIKALDEGKIDFDEAMRQINQA